MKARFAKFAKLAGRYKAKGYSRGLKMAETDTGVRAQVRVVPGAFS
jgi:hypothetical protein